MKNIKYPLILLLQLFVFQMLFGQAQIDKDGRLLGTAPQQVNTPEETVKQSQDAVNEIDDADIPGTYYLNSGSQEDIIIGEENPTDLLDRLDNLETELQQVRLYNEQLAIENQTIKKEMGNCCSEAAANLNSSSSFLLQNSPNPFREETKVQFFVEETAKDASLEIRNIEGVLLKTIQLDQRGLGELNLDKQTVTKGSYIYTLSIDGQMIDSKVMILF